MMDTTVTPESIDVLWITAGLGCDGDTISMTAATQPSIEELVKGALPGVPKLRLHNPVLARENGDEFMRRFEQASEGLIDPFILVIEGSIPDETNKAEGYWAGFGTDRSTGQPFTTCSWIDRLAPRAWGLVITSAGAGSRKPASPSSVCPAVPFSPTTSRRPCCTSCGRQPELRR
jgi:hydrogenase small subunit